MKCPNCKHDKAYSEAVYGIVFFATAGFLLLLSLLLPFLIFLVPILGLAGIALIAMDIIFRIIRKPNTYMCFNCHAKFEK